MSKQWKYTLPKQVTDFFQQSDLAIQGCSCWVYLMTWPCTKTNPYLLATQTYRSIVCWSVNILSYNYLGGRDWVRINWGHSSCYFQKGLLGSLSCIARDNWFRNAPSLISLVMDCRSTDVFLETYENLIWYQVQAQNLSVLSWLLTVIHVMKRILIFTLKVQLSWALSFWVYLNNKSNFCALKYRSVIKVWDSH